MRLHVIMAAAIVAAASASAWAKLPPPTDEQKAKAEEAKQKAAEGAKKAAELLSKYEDKAVENYKRNKGVKAGGPAASKAKKK